VNRLIPYAAGNKLWLPADLYRTGHDGRSQDLVQILIEEEMLPWPVPLHDDLVDAISRVFDVPGMTWPRLEEEGPRPERYATTRRRSWMAG
jgi:hypothetical protein